MHHWVITPRGGVPLRIVPVSESESVGVFQESHSLHAVMGIMDALSHDERLAAAIYDDLIGHGSHDRGRHVPLDEHQWAAVENAFLHGRYVLAPVGNRGHLYTPDPNEVPARTTTPAIKDLISGLGIAWPVLTTNGTWSLTAQYMHETNDGQKCFNWNLGNVKSPHTNVPHMYLRNNAEIENGKRVIRQPPHPSSRFRAYSSLAEGIQHWIGYYTRLVAKRPEFLTALNAGDLTQVAHILHEVGYYTAFEALYAAALKRKWAEIVKTLKTTP